MNKIKKSQIKKVIRGANADQKKLVDQARKPHLGYFHAVEKAGYSVEAKTVYHFRINDRLDYWPARKKYHDIKTNKRGVVDGNLVHFLDHLLKPKKTSTNYVQVAGQSKQPESTMTTASTGKSPQRRSDFVTRPICTTPKPEPMFILTPDRAGFDFSPQYKEKIKKRERREMIFDGLALLTIILIAAYFGLLD